MATNLLISADDRSGALEAGGAVADAGFEVWVGRAARPAADCSVQDIESRHLSPAQAAAKTVVVHRSAADWRCHKMDSVLRGNWASEACALASMGMSVAIVASFPDAGRRCEHGTVLVHDVPVAHSAYGRDPRSGVISSRPADFIKAAGGGDALAAGRIVVLDAVDNPGLVSAVTQCRDEGRVVVGTTGAIGAFASGFGRVRPSRPGCVPRPVLLVCGSLNALSRAQVAGLDCAKFTLGEELGAIAPALRAGQDVVLTSADADGPIAASEAERTAIALARATWAILSDVAGATLFVIGGDTAAAVLGDRAARIVGSVVTSVPWCVLEDGGRTVIAKGGGMGAPDTLIELLDRD